MIITGLVCMVAEMLQDESLFLGTLQILAFAILFTEEEASFLHLQSKHTIRVKMLSDITMNSHSAYQYYSVALLQFFACL